MNNKPNLTATAAAHYNAHVARTAAHLRRIADEVEREGTATNAFRGWHKGEHDYVYAAQQVVHTVTWGVAHLNLPGLISYAAEVHDIRAWEASQNPEDA